MLFCIGRSVATALGRGDTEALDFIITLVESRKRGLLLIYASAKTVDSVCTCLVKLGHVRTAELLGSIAKRFREKKQLLKDLTRFVIVGAHGKSPRLHKRGRIVYLPAFVINRSNMFYPPVLLGEDLSDCELYVNRLAAGYALGVPVSMREMKLSQRFEPGGGNNTHTSYGRHKQLELDFCLCVVDSDRTCPTNSVGDTAKFVMKVDQTSQSALCRYILIDTYSAENLLPIDELEYHFKIGKSAAQIESFSLIRRMRELDAWQYLPLKKGIKGKDMRSAKGHGVFWRQTLDSMGAKVDCCVMEDCECRVVPNIGEKTLAHALDPSRNWVSQLSNEPNQLVKENYGLISREVRSWLCTGAPLRG